MSQPKRWGLCWTAKVEDPEQGAWVEYADYAALAAEFKDEIDEVVKDRHNLYLQNNDLKDQIDRLTEEVEVLRKKVEWLQKADRLVIWNGTEWQVRHVVEQPIKPRQ